MKSESSELHVPVFLAEPDLILTSELPNSHWHDCPIFLEDEEDIAPDQQTSWEETACQSEA
jgi:hypothetical protein